MIIEINKDNINLLDNTFIKKEYLKEEINNNPFAKIVVYKKSGLIIGYLYYSEIYDRIEINQIEVLETYRRFGIASILLEYLTKKKKNITLEVRENNIPAINLYKKYNFKQTAIRKNYYKDQDGLLMERECN